MTNRNSKKILKILTISFTFIILLAFISLSDNHETVSDSYNYDYDYSDDYAYTDDYVDYDYSNYDYSDSTDYANIPPADFDINSAISSGNAGEITSDQWAYENNLASCTDLSAYPNAQSALNSQYPGYSMDLSGGAATFADGILTNGNIAINLGSGELENAKIAALNEGGFSVSKSDSQESSETINFQGKEISLADENSLITISDNGDITLSGFTTLTDEKGNQYNSAGFNPKESSIQISDDVVTLTGGASMVDSQGNTITSLEETKIITTDDYLDIFGVATFIDSNGLKSTIGISQSTGTTYPGHLILSSLTNEYSIDTSTIQISPDGSATQIYYLDENTATKYAAVINSMTQTEELTITKVEEILKAEGVSVNQLGATANAVYMSIISPTISTTSVPSQSDSTAQISSITTVNSDGELETMVQETHVLTSETDSGTSDTTSKISISPTANFGLTSTEVSGSESLRIGGSSISSDQSLTFSTQTAQVGVEYDSKHVNADVTADYSTASKTQTTEVNLGYDSKYVDIDVGAEYTSNDETKKETQTYNAVADIGDIGKIVVVVSNPTEPSSSKLTVTTSSGPVTASATTDYKEVTTVSASYTTDPVTVNVIYGSTTGISGTFKPSDSSKVTASYRVNPQGTSQGSTIYTYTTTNQEGTEIASSVSVSGSSDGEYAIFARLELRKF